MKKLIMPIIAAAMLLVSTPVKAVGDVTFDPETKYSKLVINSCLYNFYANTTQAGFPIYNENGELQSATIYGASTRGFDYVPGLVAKAVLEAVEYYQDSTFSYPWFCSIEAHGNAWYNGQSVKFGNNTRVGLTNAGGSLDNLNAAKLYFGLKNLTKENAKYSSQTNTNANCETALTRAATALSDHNVNCSISADTSYAFCGDNSAYVGGWWHKSDYRNQMWCDGQYMGPALLAELLVNGKTLNGKSKDECWEIIVKQFDLTWNKLWDSEEHLLYHVFSASPRETYGHTETWADFSGDYSTNSHYGVSQTYWGRAEGWYVLALVDVLEAMEKDSKKNDADYVKLKGYLREALIGLQEHQHSTGCWYQLLGYDNQFYAIGTTDASKKDQEHYYYSSGAQSTSAIYNYLEGTCSEIFAATFLKAIRLGLIEGAGYDGISFETTAKKAFQGCVEQFLHTGVDNEYDLIYGCASAGLGGKGDDYKVGAKKYRNGKPEYYLQGNDVTKVTNRTEGKSLGAFILAAVEYEKAYHRYVTYDINGHGELTNNRKLVIKGQTLTLPELSADGEYQFGGWYKNQACTEQWNAGDLMGDNMTLYAKWYIPSFSVTYNCNGATSGCPENLTEQTNLPNPLPEPTKTGFRFDGWFTDENCAQAATAGTALTENVNLYAKWTALYTINVSSNNAEYGVVSKATIADVPDGTAISWNGNTFTVNEQQVTATAKTNTAQYSYDFTGWSSQPTTVDGNLDLVANFTRTTNQYTITFDMQGHGDQVAQQVKDYGAVVAQPTAPTASGYSFDGWYAEAACQNAWDFATTITGNVTLYAKWTRVYTITYVTEGDLDQSAWVKSYTGEQEVALPTPERSGYEFLGWYENSQKVTSIPQGSTGDKTFTAEWIETCNYLRVIE